MAAPITGKDTEEQLKLLLAQLQIQQNKGDLTEKKDIDTQALSLLVG